MQQWKQGLLVALVGLLWSVTGCATIINGTTQTIPITSSPDGATVQVDQWRGTTPTTVELSRKRAHLVQIEKPGYLPETVKLERVVSGAVAGNILAGGLIGWGVDAASGGQYRLVPDHVQVTLRPNGGAIAPAADGRAAPLGGVTGAMQCAEPDLRGSCQVYRVRTDLYRTYCAADRSVATTLFGATGATVTRDSPPPAAGVEPSQAERCALVPLPVS